MTEIIEMADEYGSVFKANTFEESSWVKAKAARFCSVIFILDSSGMVSRGFLLGPGCFRFSIDEWSFFPDPCPYKLA